MTYVSSDLSPALRSRPIHDVTVDWERFVPRVRPVDLVVVHWDELRSHVGTAAGDPLATRTALPRAEQTTSSG
jgi:hypothetical protein